MTLSNRHAVCFGINYESNPRARLRGCVNDVKNIGKMLFGSFGFRDVRVFCDDVPNPHTTKEKIMEEISALADRSKEHELETAWIHFSGHGTQIADNNGDELDGRDECILPSDFENKGLIRDDELRFALSKFNPNTKVICIFDCCHSGTIMDLKYTYVNNSVSRTENKAAALSPRIMCISGCMDTQTSADAYNVRGNREFSGAMTSSLMMAITSMKNINDIRVLELMDKLHYYLKRKRFQQVPQLTSSYEMGSSDTLF